MSTAESKILISGLFKRAIASDTLEQYWRMILWALMVLCLGFFPSHDSEGNGYAAGTDERARAGWALADGLFVVVWGIHSDQDWMANSLRLEHFSSLRMCPWCCATLTDEEHADLAALDAPIAPWNDLSDDAVWRRSFVFYVCA